MYRVLVLFILISNPKLLCIHNILFEEYEFWISKIDLNRLLILI